MMQGQWIGCFKGTNTGSITLNIELSSGEYQGQAIIFDTNTNLTSSIASVHMHDTGNNSFTGKLSNFLPINKMTLLPDQWTNVKSTLDPSVIMPTTGSITCHLNESGKINGNWSTNIGTNGEFELIKSAAESPSIHPCDKKTWDEFKELVSTLNNSNYIFRGQTNPSRLRTTFHRTGKSDFSNYSKNILDLHRHVCAHTDRILKLDNVSEYGALLFLAQHHGYPTPLLDWTRSPYIATYFAYAELQEITPEQKVRIYIFDSTSWRNDTQQVTHLNSPILSISPLDLIPIHNKRAIPQQSVTTFSNIDDMESFIQHHEKRNKKTYLRIIELPSEEKEVVLRELNFMGIHAGSLFPGLDGICRMLKEQHY